MDIKDCLSKSLDALEYLEKLFQAKATLLIDHNKLFIRIRIKAKGKHYGIEIPFEPYCLFVTDERLVKYFEQQQILLYNKIHCDNKAKEG